MSSNTWRAWAVGVFINLIVNSFGFAFFNHVLFHLSFQVVAVCVLLFTFCTAIVTAYLKTRIDKSGGLDLRSRIAVTSLVLAYINGFVLTAVITNVLDKHFGTLMSAVSTVLYVVSVVMIYRRRNVPRLEKN